MSFACSLAENCLISRTLYVIRVTRVKTEHTSIEERPLEVIITLSCNIIDVEMGLCCVTAVQIVVSGIDCMFRIYFVVYLQNIILNCTFAIKN